MRMLRKEEEALEKQKTVGKWFNNVYALNQMIVKAMINNKKWSFIFARL